MTLVLDTIGPVDLLKLLLSDKLWTVCKNVCLTDNCNLLIIYPDLSFFLGYFHQYEPIDFVCLFSYHRIGMLILIVWYKIQLKN